MTYEEAIKYLEAANVFGIQLGLGRIQNLLERLGNPQNKYKTVHVTGTNGKGSVTAMIASALTEAGFKTGRYTSPHLESYTERIHIDHHDISEDDFAAAVAVVKEAVTAMVADGGEGPTEFELITAAAFWYLPASVSTMPSSKSDWGDSSIRPTSSFRPFRSSPTWPWTT